MPGFFCRLLSAVGLASSAAGQQRPHTLKELQAERQRLSLELECARLESARRMVRGFHPLGELAPRGPRPLSEAVSNVVPDWVGSYVDLLDRYRDGQNLLTPITTPNDHRFGRNFPIFQTEQELNILRAPARVLCATNSYAQGILEGLTSYVIGDGMTYRCVPSADEAGGLDRQAQDILDEFMERERWGELERELFWMSREDGENFLLHGLDNGVTWVRIVWPEQVHQPPGTGEKEWSFGVRTSPEDVQRHLAYWVGYLNQLADGDEVAAAGLASPGEPELLQTKINTKRAIKRGLTDFCFDTYDSLNVASKLDRNLGEGAAVRAAIAYLRQHEGMSLGNVSTFQQGLVDYTRSDPVTGRAYDQAKAVPGMVLDIGAGSKYLPSPAAASAEGDIAILHALLRRAAMKWNAPEWLATASGADMAAYTASLTAESPFVRWGQAAQKFYGWRFKQTMLIVLRHAVHAERIAPDVLQRVDVQVKPRSLIMRDGLQEAQKDNIYYSIGAKSIPTIQAEQGLDTEEEAANTADWQERTGNLGPGQQLSVPPDDPNPTPPAPRAA